jgi:hypothetical protein
MPQNGRETVQVVKLNTLQQETWRYAGKVITRTPESILLEAFFNRPDRVFHGILLAEGDRFLEKYYTNHWYNIFEIHDKSTNALKGWYCNVTYPAVFANGTVSYIDLALDLLVYPDGRQLVLDEDEFTDLHLNVNDAKKACEALQELQLILKMPYRLS